MKEKIKIHGQEWRFKDIKENVEWAKKQKWKFKKYDNEGEHDHCLICYWTISASEDSESGEAYFYGGSTWLCKECYEKFIK